MSKRDKLIEKIRARPPEASFADVRALLEAFGWREGRNQGTHVTFVKENERSIIIIAEGGRLVKRTYLTLICDRLGLLD